MKNALDPLRHNYMSCAQSLAAWLCQFPQILAVIDSLDGMCYFVGGTTRDGLRIFRSHSESSHSESSHSESQRNITPITPIAPITPINSGSLVDQSSGQCCDISAMLPHAVLNHADMCDRNMNTDLWWLCRRGVDMSSPLLPDHIEERLVKAGFDVDVSAKRFGVFMVSTDHCVIEIAAMREDTDYNGRFPQVRFGVDLERDSLRRDFTVNALYVSVVGDVVDPCNGLRDLDESRVRFIGDATASMLQDRVRLLRYFRCAADLRSTHIQQTTEWQEIMARRDYDDLGLLTRSRLARELVSMIVRPYLDWTCVDQSRALQQRAPVPLDSQPLVCYAHDCWVNRYVPSNQEALQVYVHHQQPQHREVVADYLGIEML